MRNLFKKVTDSKSSSSDNPQQSESVTEEVSVYGLEYEISSLKSEKSPLSPSLAKSVRFDVCSPRGYYPNQVNQFVDSVISALDFYEGLRYRYDQVIYDLQVEVARQTHDVVRLKREIEVFRVMGSPVTNADGSYVRESQVADAADQHELAAVQAELEQAEARNSELEDRLGRLQAQYAELEAAHQVLDQRSGNISTEMNRMGQAVAQAEARAVESEEKVASLSSELEQAVDLVAQYDAAWDEMAERLRVAEEAVLAMESGEVQEVGAGEEAAVEDVESVGAYQEPQVAHDIEAEYPEGADLEQDYEAEFSSGEALEGSADQDVAAEEVGSSQAYEAVSSVEDEGVAEFEEEPLPVAAEDPVAEEPVSEDQYVEEQYVEPVSPEAEHSDIEDAQTEHTEEEYAEEEYAEEEYAEEEYDPTWQYDNQLPEDDEDDSEPAPPVIPVDSELPEGVELPRTGEAAVTYRPVLPGTPLARGNVPEETWAPELDEDLRRRLTQQAQAVQEYEENQE